MKWYVIEDEYPNDCCEDSFYRSYELRQIQLPMRMDHIGKRSSILRISLPPDIKIRWKKRHVPTIEEYEKFRDPIIALAPEHAAAIRALPPGSQIGHLIVNRFGPACPAIEQIGGGFLARESLRSSLETIEDIQLFPAYWGKVVPLDWELGQPIPKAARHRPEAYLDRGKHSPEVAVSMGKLYEVVLPPRLSHYPVHEVPTGAKATPVAFPVTSLEHPVEVAVESFDKHPWFLAVSAADKASTKVDRLALKPYVFAREDVCSLLREASRWTLAFREVTFK